MILENAQEQLKEAFDFIRKNCSSHDGIICHPNSLKYLLYPKRVIMVNIPIKMDDGRVKVFKWFRSQHNNARWPFKGWIRFHPDVTLEEVKALSIWMTFKTAVVNIPLWGGKWWVVVNPKRLSETELERLARWYVRAIYRNIWPDKDSPAPDVNTSSQIMARMVDEYNHIVGKNAFGAFTWKPLSIWWSAWREIATSLWWVYVLEECLETRWTTVKWKKVVIQWAGNAWLNLAKLLIERWSKIIWISDSKWWIYNPDWLDIEKIELIKKERKSVIDYKDAENITNEQLLELDCDILAPSALENQITEKNAHKIKASVVLELANWPTTIQADKILFERWIDVLPDILANAWWVTVSYFEMVQNNTNFYWSEEEVYNKLEKIMKKATKDVIQTALKHKTFFRNWAYIIGIKRVLEAMRDRGILR